MARGSREKDIKLLVAKFITLVESLNPGERLSIKKVAARRTRTAKAASMATSKTTSKAASKATSKKSARADGQRSQTKQRKP
jgi:hypothetical protein